MERGSAQPGRMAWAAGTLLGALAFGLPVSVSAQQPSPVGQFNDQTQPRTDPRIA
nr:porin [Methylorubrum extorquens]